MRRQFSHRSSRGSSAPWRTRIGRRSLHPCIGPYLIHRSLHPITHRTTAHPPVEATWMDSMLPTGHAPCPAPRLGNRADNQTRGAADGHAGTDERMPVQHHRLGGAHRAAERDAARLLGVLIRRGPSSSTNERGRTRTGSGPFAPSTSTEVRPAPRRPAGPRRWRG